MKNIVNLAVQKVRGVFFGWWIVVAGLILQGLNAGLLGQGFTVYFLPLQDEFGWSRTLLSTGFSLSNIVNGIFSPFVGWLSDKFGPRRIVLAGVVLFGAGFIMLSTVHSIVTFFLAFALLAGGGSLGGYLPLSVVVLNWFVRKRALTLGISSSGMGLGGVIVPLLALSIINFGWRETAFGSGIIFLVVGTACALTLRHRPEEYGYLPDGDSPSSKGIDEKTGTAGLIDIAQLPGENDFTAREALKTRTFWLIAAGHASAVLTVSAVSLHLAPLLVQQLDMSLQSAGTYVSILLFMSIIGRILGGVLADRIDSRWLLVASMISHTIGLLILANATQTYQVILFTIFHGMAWGARGLLQNSIRAEYFGRKAIGSILGIATVPVVLAIVISPIITGWLADLQGNYHFAFMILAGYTAAGTFLFGFAKRPVKSQA